MKLNENDIKLLGFCMNEKKKMRQIAEHLGIAVKNVFVRLNKLSENGLINIEKGGCGKSIFVKTKVRLKTKKHFIILLSEIKKREGVTKEEFLRILPFDLNDQKGRDRFNDQMILQGVTPKLIETRLFITKKGEKFLRNSSYQKRIFVPKGQSALNPNMINPDLLYKNRQL